MPGSNSALLAGLVESGSVGGGPVTRTASVKATVMLMTEPAPYAPPLSGEETDTIDGGVSIRALRPWPSEPGEPGGGSSRSAAASGLFVSPIVPRVTSAPGPA